MARYFEDLKVWAETREFIKEIYLLTDNEYIRNDFSFKNQIRRAAISVLNNIAEGHERNNNKEFIKFLIYSKGSAGEIRSMLYIALDLNYITQEEFDYKLNKVLIITKQLANLIKYLKSNLLKKDLRP
jgi:four helix bundle protein